MTQQGSFRQAFPRQDSFQQQSLRHVRGSHESSASRATASKASAASQSFDDYYAMWRMRGSSLTDAEADRLVFVDKYRFTKVGNTKPPERSHQMDKQQRILYGIIINKESKETTLKNEQLKKIEKMKKLYTRKNVDSFVEKAAMKTDVDPLQPSVPGTLIADLSPVAKVWRFDNIGGRDAGWQNTVGSSVISGAVQKNEADAHFWQFVETTAEYQPEPVLPTRSRWLTSPRTARSPHKTNRSTQRTGRDTLPSGKAASTPKQDVATPGERWGDKGWDNPGEVSEKPSDDAPGGAASKKKNAPTTMIDDFLELPTEEHDKEGSVATEDLSSSDDENDDVKSYATSAKQSYATQSSGMTDLDTPEGHSGAPTSAADKNAAKAARARARRKASTNQSGPSSFMDDAAEEETERQLQPVVEEPRDVHLFAEPSYRTLAVVNEADTAWEEEVDQLLEWSKQLAFDDFKSYM